MGSASIHVSGRNEPGRTFLGTAAQEATRCVPRRSPQESLTRQAATSRRATRSDPRSSASSAFIRIKTSSKPTTARRTLKNRFLAYDEHFAGAEPLRLNRYSTAPRPYLFGGCRKNGTGAAWPGSTRTRRSGGPGFGGTQRTAERPDGHIGFAGLASLADAPSRYLDGVLRRFTRRSGSGYLRSTL